MGSIDEVELIIELEEEFGLSLLDDETERVQSIGDAIRYIEKRRRERGE
jgi:acyl carrier protein